jgi:hypothetical protein
MGDKRPRHRRRGKCFSTMIGDGKFRPYPRRPELRMPPVQAAGRAINQDTVEPAGSRCRPAIVLHLPTISTTKRGPVSGPWATNNWRVSSADAGYFQGGTKARIFPAVLRLGASIGPMQVMFSDIKRYTVNMRAWLVDRDGRLMCLAGGARIQTDASLGNCFLWFAAQTSRWRR